MLSIPTATGADSRLHYRANRGDAWRRRTPSVFTTALDLKRQQLVEKYQQFESNTPMSSDTEQPEEAAERRPTPPKQGMPTAFRLMTFSESDGEEDNEYEPSEDEENDVREEGEELLEPHQEEEQEETTETEEEEKDPDDDSRWWKSSEDRYRWEKRYKQTDAAFRTRFGCGIDTPTHPETRRKLKKKKSRYQPYKYVLAGFVVVNLVQLALVYSASSSAFSMVMWRSSTEKAVDGDDALADATSNEHNDDIITPSSQQQVPEHVRTGLYLCSSLSRRVVKSEHDVTATQHALRACDIAVKFAPMNTREAVEAHVLRGDLRSLLALFDGADEDYNAAMKVVLESSANLKLLPELTHDLDLKLVANRWTQLYKSKSFKELRREVKARVRQEGSQSGVDNVVSVLAADWLSAFKRKKPVLDVLTLQRGLTLRRLKYEAVDDGKKIFDRR